MGFGIGNLGQIVSDFGEALNQIFGGGSSGPQPKGGIGLYNIQYGGSTWNADSAAKWTGNAQRKQVRYGFAQVTSKGLLATLDTAGSFYYLDIPPQAISQKEVFATNISATRRGIIVESEGVVFKDIVIQGTTGVFPGERGNYKGPQANFSDITAAPKAPEGVGAKTGRSKKSTSKVVSGYEEFLGLRQYFLSYAFKKTQNNGDLFLVFINEKDNQALVVEPLEFTMERSSKSPMTYNYRIVLKAISNLNAAFKLPPDAKPSLLEQIGNVFANASAAIEQGRAAVNATSNLFQQTFQAIDQTVNGPLRQLQFALEDLNNGISDTLALPEILIRNTSSAILGIRENAAQLGQTIGVNNSAAAAANAATITATTPVLTKIGTDSKIPVPRAFVSDIKVAVQEQSDNIADSLNLSDPLYNSIKGRIVTSNPGPLKIASDEEFLLLGNVKSMADTLNIVLANNDAFESDAEKAFDDARQAFVIPGLPQETQPVNIHKPSNVKEVAIRRNDTLEKIAAREFQDATRWPELVVLNQLKYPYISDDGGDHVKKYGETLLVGVD